MRVPIAGGGVAALEGLLALRDLAEDRVEIELLSPVETFTYRPLEVGAPFALGKARAYDLERIAAARGATFIKDALRRVDTARRTVLTRSGEELGFDALLIAIGGGERVSTNIRCRFRCGFEQLPRARSGLSQTTYEPGEDSCRTARSPPAALAS